MWKKWMLTNDPFIDYMIKRCKINEYWNPEGWTLTAAQRKRWRVFYREFLKTLRQEYFKQLCCLNE